jgi:hypothetical protein
MQILGILWPTFALVALVFAVWFTMFVQRTRHMARTPPGEGDFADAEAAMRYFRPVAMPANNLANLFEMPVLYFALVPLLVATHAASNVQVIVAWAFVGLRYAHSIVHIGTRTVPARFIVYLASCIMLSAMWIGFFVDATTAAVAMHRAVEAMGAVAMR